MYVAFFSLFSKASVLLTPSPNSLAILKLYAAYFNSDIVL
jgi:hypothetical protein